MKRFTTVFMGEDSPAHKFTWEEIQGMRQMFFNGSSQKEIAYLFKADLSTVNRVINLKTRVYQ